MTRVIFLAAVTAALAACSAPDPTYNAPTDADAVAAYRANLEGKIAAWKPAENGSEASGPVDTPSEYASTAAATIDLVQDLGDFAILRRNLNGLVTIKVKSCEWGELDLDEVKQAQRPDYAVDVDYGYRCKVETFHRAADGAGVLAYERNVYLFQNGPAFAYIEIDEGPARYASAGEVSV